MIKKITIRNQFIFMFPLCACDDVVDARLLFSFKDCGRCWIRTNEGLRRQVYSLLLLATQETYLNLLCHT